MTFLDVFEGVESESAIISESPKWREGEGLSIVNRERPYVNIQEIFLNIIFWLILFDLYLF